MNNKILKTTKIVGALVLAGACSTVFAAPQTAILDANVTVKNAFTLTKTGSFNFGTIRANQVSTGVATITLDPRTSSIKVGTPTHADANISIIDSSAKALPVLTIADAAGTTKIFVSVPTDSTVLESSSYTGAQFVLKDVTANITAGGAVGTPVVVATPAEFETLADGTLSLTLGATLQTTSAATPGTYNDEVFSGSLTVSVDY